MPFGMIEADVEAGDAVALEGKSQDGVLERLLQRQYGRVHVLLLLPADDGAILYLKITLGDRPALGQLWSVEFFLQHAFRRLADQELQIGDLFCPRDCGENRHGDQCSSSD